MKLAEASHLVVRLETPALAPTVRMKLQLSFYQPPFSSQFIPQRLVLEYFILFLPQGPSSQSEMQQRVQMHQLKLLWVVQSLLLLLGLD